MILFVWVISFTKKIINNEADDILIDMVSLNEYMQRNRRMQELLKALSDIDGAEITYSDPESYIEQLKWLKKNTIGDLQDMLEKNFELVIKLARRTLEGMEIDILASNAALRLLCRAELLSGGYTEEQAAGCAVGNIIANIASGYEISYALLNGAQQLLYGLLAYVLWRRINKEDDENKFCLDSISRLLMLFLVMAVVAAVTVVCSAVTNHVYNVSDIITVNSLYAFINTFDSGVMFGCPLMIGGHLLQKYLMNLSSGKKEKIITFSLNERIILNTLITGLGICLLIGTAVYITDKISSDKVAMGLWGRIYLFQTLALNFYFVISMGFMYFTEKRISRPVERLADVAQEYYAEHSDDEGRKKLLKACTEFEI